MSDPEKAPRLSAADLMVLVDTALGSLCIHDRFGHYKFSAETRESVAHKALALLERVEVETP